MVDMGVAQNHTVNLGGVETQIAVIGVRLHTFTLVHAAIQKNSVPRIGSDKMLATRYFARSA